MLGVSDWISITSTLASLLLAILIADLQYRQSAQMADMERRIDERDEKRHAESVDAQAAGFIISYGSDRGYIPLCAIAAMYDDSFLYSREIYRAFNCLPLEVQNRVLERCGMDLRVHTIDNFQDRAIAFIQCLVDEEFPGDQSPFYDDAKYITRSILEHRDERAESLIDIVPTSGIPQCQYYDHQWFDDYIRVVLDDVLEGHISTDSRVLNGLMCAYSFFDSDQVRACQFTTTLAYWIIALSKKPDESRNYGDIFDVLTSDERTLEDLFLTFLYAYYIRYVA